ncbi:polyprenyl synthetase family protein [Lentzea sp. NPDC059081]|uniref:polyprenyl synthetase family protein n=1 Tax=Lentzea sp. NPDC059081 TaxID=3346719 RepID=UPI00367A0F4C
MTELDVLRIADSEVAALVQAEVESRWPHTASGVDELVRYGLVPFGKMMGPWLLIRSSLAVGGDIASVLPAAVAVECIQVGAMMHDDIIDDAPERRGKASAYTVYGAPAAIVGGDALFFHGFAALSDCLRTGVPEARVVRALGMLAEIGVRIGDAAVTEIRMSRALCSVDAYLNMIRDKSGALLWMACGIGVALAGGDDVAVEAFRRYCDLLGIAYQIRDDLMTFDGTRAGKPNVSDVDNGRPTLPVLLAHHHASAAGRRAIEELLADTTAPVEQRYAAMAELVTANDGVEAAREMSHEYGRRAATALLDLPATEHRDALVELALPGRLV